jgi:hypothetical protein
VKVCNQITLLIVYYVSSRLVNFLKVADAPVQVSDILFCTVCFSFMILPSTYSLCSCDACYLHICCCSHYLHYCGLDHVNTAFVHARTNFLYNFCVRITYKHFTTLHHLATVTRLLADATLMQSRA